ASATHSSEPDERPATSPAARRYTREQVLALGREGAKAYEDGDLKRARAIFEDLVEADPNSSDAEAALGALLVRTGENDDALIHLDRAIQLNPQALSAYVNRGEVHLR